MKNKMKSWKPVFVNNIDAFIPEVWAAESLMVLEAEMVTAQLVHRNFSKEIAQQGDVVNTRRPAKFTAKRKGVNTNVVKQDATATNVPVTLDQHLYTSFIIKDGEESKGMQSLLDTYLQPAVTSIGRAVDEIVLMSQYQFATVGVGSLGSAATKTDAIAVDTKFNELLVPADGNRHCVMTAATKGDLLNVTDFTKVNEAGDGGSALRRAQLGDLFDTHYWMSQNAPSIDTSLLNTVSKTVNLVGGYAKGYSGSIVIITGSIPTVGAWCEAGGRPYRITASDATHITFDRPLDTALPDAAPITINDSTALVNLPAGYNVGDTEGIAVDSFAAGELQKGQGLTFDSVDNRYGVLSGLTTTEMLLDRNLVANVANNAKIFGMPGGNWNWCFHQNAVGMISRPLAPPRAGTGALSATANMNGTTMRVTMTYDGDAQGHLVTVDLLFGIKVFDANMGFIMYG